MDVGRESYANEKKKKTKKKPDTKEERECTTPDTVDSCINHKEGLLNGYCRSDSMLSKQEEDNMDKGNDSDSSSVINQEMDEMIVVKKKRRNRIKNGVDNNAAQLPAAPTHSRSLPEGRSQGLDKQRQRILKSNNDAKLKPLKISTASFDMDQDFPPLNSHPLSATIRREKVQSPPKSVDKPQVHPSKSDSDLTTPTKKELQRAIVRENQQTCEDEVSRPAEIISDKIVVKESADKDKETETNVDLKEKLDTKMVEQTEEHSEVIINFQKDVNNVEDKKNSADQPSEQPGPSSGRNKGRQSSDRRSHSQNNFSTHPHSYKHRPRFNNANSGSRRARYPGFQNSNNYGYNNPLMNVSYMSPNQAASGFPFMHPSASSPGYGYAQLPPLYPHAPTGFIPNQTFLPMQLPYQASNFERFQGPSLLQKYPRGYPVHANGPPPGITRSVVSNNVSKSSTVISNEINTNNTVQISPATTPVADYNGRRPPSVPVTLCGNSGAEKQHPTENVKNTDCTHRYRPSGPTGIQRSFNITSSLPYTTSRISVVDSTKARIADTNVSPLSQSPDSPASSTTRPATTTGSSNSDPSLVNPSSLPRSIDTLTLSPELQKTVREAFGLQPNEGIFYVYATNEKGEHTRQMRVILHNTTPVKFEKFASPVYLSPTLGPAGVFSPTGFYYAKQEKFSVPSSEGHPPVVHAVTQHHPVLSFSATIPEQYQIPLMPTYYQDVIVLPAPPSNRPSVPVLPSNPDSTPPSTPMVHEPESLPKLSPFTNELSSTSTTTSSNDTSAQ
uniref:Uncharacterized protein n=1 Tax=Panagrolaimus sp. ES5 TaxID=591445 RepID=A0AC34EZH2_9BILA